MKIHQNQLLSIVNSRKTIMNQIQNSFSKISSGSNVTKAADDPYGSRKLMGIDVQLRTLNKRQEGIQDRVSFLQVKESALGDMTSMVQRIRELTVESANGTLSKDDKNMINEEIKQIKEGLLDVYHNTEFNELNVFKGFDGPKEQVKDIDMKNLFIGNYNEVMSKVDDIIFRDLDVTLTDYISTKEGGSLDEIDKVIHSLSSERGVTSAMQYGLESYGRHLALSAENLVARKSKMYDTDIAKASMELAKAQLLDQSTLVVMLHIQENNQNVLKLLL